LIPERLVAFNHGSACPQKVAFFISQDQFLWTKTTQIVSFRIRCLTLQHVCYCMPSHIVKWPQTIFLFFHKNIYKNNQGRKKMTRKKRREREKNYLNL